MKGTVVKYFLLFFLTFLSCYSLLIICDYILDKKIIINRIELEKDKNIKIKKENEKQNQSQTKSETKKKIEINNNIERENLIKKLSEENILLINEAKQKGFENYYYPELYDKRSKMFYDISKDFNFAPVGSKPYTKTFYCNEGYGLIKFNTDRFGLRNNDLKWSQKIDTFFIGDSFAAGACVNDNQTIPAQYEKFTGENSINLSSSGNNPFHYAALSNIFIPIFKPKKVFLIFYANDNKNEINPLYDLYVLKKKNYFKQVENKKLINKFYKKIKQKTNQELEKRKKIAEQQRKLEEEKAKLEIERQKRQEKIDYLNQNRPLYYKIYNSIKYRSKLPTIRKVLGLDIDKKKLGLDINKKKTIIEKSIHIARSTSSIGDILASGRSAKEAIRITKELCIKFKCEVNVAYIPNSKYWKPINETRTNNFINILKNYSTLKNINFFDFSLLLDREKNSLDYATKGGHLSPQGYKKVSKVLIN